jgi:dTDP-4-dehydrorhamnose reductase
MVMRIYIIGGSGMIGHAFIKYFSANHTVYAPSHKEVDVTMYVDVRESIKNFAPDVVINLAALCDMEACELNPDRALKIHAHGSATAALAAERSNATYVYLSSACVFDGEDPAYSPVSLPRPISIYGKTKLMGENIARSVAKHVVLRTEWCFGGGPENDKKFIGKIYRQIQTGAKLISAVTDKCGSLSYLPDLAFALEKILEQGRFGTFHVACSGSANRYEIAAEFVRLIGANVKVEGVDSSYFTHFAIYDAPRPTSEILIPTRIEGFMPRDWREALAEYAREFQLSEG